VSVPIALVEALATPRRTVPWRGPISRPVANVIAVAWVTGDALFSIRVFDSVATVPQVVARWSNQRGWGEAHRLALAGGALLT
jgi:hypothetical protein